MTKDNRPEIQKVLIITLLLNMLVVGLKGFLGYATGSLSLLADALHSMTDGASNILGLVANRYSAPEPDREHPYGHQKFESVGALGIAVLLVIACFEILQGIVERITQGSEPVEISPVELWLLLVVLGINIFVAFYERRVGQRLGSAILIADATHTMSDVWVTISVIGGLIGVWRGYQWLDVVLAFPVALLVLGSAWSVLKSNLPWLVDQMAIAPETIEAIATAVPGVINCHDIASRGVLGRQVFIEIHLIIDAVDVETAHKISEEVERRLERHFNPTRILIHIEPPVYQSKSAKA
ncbi:cation diffusion facilitator family transporter [Anabaenopsis tanganyikae CS-531]|uniref:Cation diffusion facilitator family transporter n=1 Tax=Anabaenopsis tanganyikae CS-531 TaxID=2785304 RepID=A0ABT6KCI3_9CYAN|nr:cation diffusion facilitator family transporter [Anabaenopsis tanganyikae]MDH6105074.1 cation diffusion facilitator family transporter [Anabaenopsis tanganyikae CS-531]